MQSNSDIMAGMETNTMTKQTKQPSMKSLEKMVFNGIAKATDGCKVEPDGVCPHGCQSWLLVVGLI